MTETMFSSWREIGVAAAATCESIRLDGESERAGGRVERPFRPWREDGASEWRARENVAA